MMRCQEAAKSQQQAAGARDLTCHRQSRGAREGASAVYMPQCEKIPSAAEPGKIATGLARSAADMAAAAIGATRTA